eukprot:maker-scaffold_14-snap-gene-9.31-mRNA-1 protein AED:0.04 eAED:0.04 QI:88/0.5/0.33/1/1/1/3/0/518
MQKENRYEKENETLHSPTFISLPLKEKLQQLKQLLFGIMSLFSTDSIVVQYGERLPYLYGLPIALFHICAKKRVQATRALSSTVLLFCISQLFPFFFFKILNYLSNKLKKPVYYSNEKIFSILKKIRLFTLTFMTFGLIFQIFWNRYLETTYPSSNSKSLSTRLNWMQSLQNLTIREILIPGSHDTGAIKGEFEGFPFFLRFIEPYSATQSLSIKDQLEAGVRSLDLRLCDAQYGAARICHGPVLHFGDFEDALIQIYNFVVENPSEIVIVFLRVAYQRYTKTSYEIREYASLIREFDEFRSRMIFPNESYTSVGNLTAQGKNLLVACSDFTCGQVFEEFVFDTFTNSEIWNSEYSPDTFLPDIYSDIDKFEFLMDRMLCGGLTDDELFGNNINNETEYEYYEYYEGFDTNETEFIVPNQEKLFVLNGQLPITVGEIFYGFWPMLTKLFSPDRDIVGWSSLEKLAGVTNKILMDTLENFDAFGPNTTSCANFTRVNIISSDFLNDDVIELIISKNFQD